MGVQAASPEFSMASAGDRDLSLSRELSITLHVVIFLAAFFLLFLRRPDALLNAQFYAEDGRYWFADAYNVGWRCLLLPVGGYLNTISRLIGLVTLLVPLVYAPLVMNLCALTAQILPIHIFLSSRFKQIPLLTRLLGSLLYLALPNSFEIHANTTNIQWHLALVGCLVLLGRQDNRWAWRIFDFLILAFVVLDGPLGILLIPMAVMLRWIRKDARYTFALIALIPPAVLQIVFLLLSGSRREADNGATLSRFTNIIGGQVFLSSVLGVRTTIHLYFENDVSYFYLVSLVALILGMAFILYALRHAPVELKLFYFFAAMVLALAMKHPLASFEARFKQWELMQIPGCGNRYYFFPMLAFLATPIWMLTNPVSKSRLARCAALVILLLLPIGICRDFRYKAFKDSNFQVQAAEFERAAPGTQIIIPIDPGWDMRLIKH
jgi:hypothetical protein